jgi:hypothetical protein
VRGRQLAGNGVGVGKLEHVVVALHLFPVAGRLGVKCEECGPHSALVHPRQVDVAAGTPGLELRVVLARDRVGVAIEYRLHGPDASDYADLMRYATAHVDELERLPAFGEPDVWRPIRHHFGIEGFGINAYTADEPGRRVIEEHDELGAAGAGRHQELYVVLSGRATFTLDSEERDAPAGTLVFIGEPDVVRGAIAAEPGTTVLAIGARPGVAFTVSPWEYRFRARAIGGPEALAILDEAAERFPEDPTVPYDLACVLALAGDRDDALEALRRAIELEPEVRKWAGAEEDFAALRRDPEFSRLVA